MSFSSKVLYTGDAVTTDFTVTFPYISQSHVSVYVNDILQLNPMNYVWSGASTISFGTAPGIDDAIEIRRWTSPTSTLVDFTDGSTLRANDLDTAYLHNYYLSQEYADSFNEVINEMLVRVATAQGITETDPDQVILELVADMVSSAAAANLQARITDIDANAEAIITLGNGLQTQINTLAQGVAANVYVQAAEPVPGVGGIPDPIAEGSRWYDTDDNNKPYIYQSGAWVSIEDPRIGDVDTYINLLQTEYGASASAFIAEVASISNEAGANTNAITLLGAVNGTNDAFILDLDTTKVGPTESLANRFSSITSSWQAADTAAIGTANAYTDAEITTEASTRAAEDLALATTMSLLGAENAGQTAFILDTSTVKIDSDVGDTFATRLSALAAADSANSASITTIQTVTIPGIQSDVTAAESDISTLEAKYGVSLNVNGYVTGFVQNNNGSSGEFVILADKFAVVDPSGDPGETQYVPFEISGGKINMRSDVKIDGNLLVTGTINGTALVNGTIGSTQIGTNAISTTHISASAITANEIATNAVTAAKINVTDLNSVNANTGALTVSGTLTMGTSGKMISSGTGFESGTGFFLGYDTSAYKFYVGNYAGGNYISWDGSTLTIRGDLEVGEYEVDATNALLSANTLRTSLSAFTWTQEKGFTMGKSGTVRVYYEIKRGVYSGSNIQNAQARIKKNGVVIHTDTATSTSFVAHTYDVAVNADDSITVEIRAGEADPVEPVAYSISIQNCQIRGNLVLTDGGSVDDN